MIAARSSQTRIILCGTHTLSLSVMTQSIESYVDAVAVGDVSKINLVVSGIEAIIKRLATSGGDNVSQFNSLILTLLKRIFGVETATGIHPLPKNWVKPCAGGWLKASINKRDVEKGKPSVVSPSDVNATDKPNKNRWLSLDLSLKSVSLDAFYLVRLLFLGSNFNDFLQRSGEKILVPTQFFPRRLQFLFSKNHAAYFNIETGSQGVYFTHFRYWSIESLRSNMVVSSVSVSPFEYFLLLMMKYPTLSTNEFASKVAADRFGSSTVSISPYFALLQHLISEILCRDDCEHSAYRKYRELFLQLAAEFWIDQALIVRRVEAPLDLNSVESGGSGRYNKLLLSSSSINLDTMTAAYTQSDRPPFHINLLDGQYPEWNVSTLECVYALLRHVLSDPTLLVKTEACMGTIVESLRDPSAWVGRRAAARPQSSHFPPLHADSQHHALRGLLSPAPASPLASSSLSPSPFHPTGSSYSRSGAGATANFSYASYYATISRAVADNISYDENQNQAENSSNRNRLMLRELSAYSNPNPPQQLSALTSDDYIRLLPCPCSLQPLQQPSFDMLRTIFSLAGQRQYGRLIFHKAVDIWLLYIQPWGLHGTSFDGRWVSFIASNLHFYTTLLGGFLNTLSDVRLDPRDGEGSLYLRSLQKVLTVFCDTVGLLTLINKIRDRFVSWYRGNHRLLLPMGSGGAGHSRLEHLQQRSFSSSPAMSYSPSTYHSDYALNRQPVIEYDAALDPETLLVMAHHHFVFPAPFPVDLRADCGVIDVASLCSRDIHRIYEALARLVQIGSSSGTNSYTGDPRLWAQFNSIVGQRSGFSEGDTASLYQEKELRAMSERLKKVGRNFSSPWESVFRTSVAVSSIKDNADVDALDITIRMHEWEPMAIFAVFLSKALNWYFALPKNDSSVVWSFRRTFRFAFDSKREGLVGVLISLQSCFRFNLRWIAHLGFLVPMAVALLNYLFREDVLFSWSSHFILFISTSTLLAWAALELFSRIVKYELKKLREGETRASLKMHDELTARLIPEAKERVCNGLAIVEKKSIRYTGDILDVPLSSFEWDLLARNLVRLSKHLNARFGLPRNSESALWTTEQVFLQAVLRSGRKYDGTFNPVLFIAACFRFNLRFLAQPRVFGAMLLSTAVSMNRLGFISDSTALVLVAFFALLTYQGRLPSK